MKLINEKNKILKVRAIDDMNNITMQQYDQNSYLFKIDDQYYFVLKREFNNRIYYTK